MKRTLSKLARGLVPAGLLALTPATALAAWTRTYVVEWYEPAMHYGGKTGVVAPGSDCPTGSNPEPDWIKVMTDAGYSREQALWLRNPANPTRSPIHGQNQMAFRGADRANVYIHPESTPDGGLVGVTGSIGEGLDLDGDAATGGFTSPTGQAGIDNAFYRALGCWKTYRGPPRLSTGALQFNDAMRDGAWTVVVVINGKGDDPQNDEHVTVGLYASSDKLVKDATGQIARDYTFRIRPDRQYEAVFQARSTGGRIRTRTPSKDVWLRDPGYARDLQILQAQIDLSFRPDGGLSGYVGGYRPWQAVYDGWVKARGPVIETLTWVRLPDVWYALRRNADYSPRGAKGEKTHISFALRLDAIPAFVATPEARQIATAISYRTQAKAADAVREKAPFNVVDGVVVPTGQAAVSLPDAALLPPLKSASVGGQ